MDNVKMETVYWMAGLVVFLTGIALHTWLTKRKVTGQLQEKYGKAVCSELVNYYGHQSRKGFEWRGLALLWLTPSEIVLVRLVPRKQIVIPVKSIVNVHSKYHFTGKLSIRPLLCVQYIRDDGKRDVMGCRVWDFDQWARQIRKLRRAWS